MTSCQRPGVVQLQNENFSQTLPGAFHGVVRDSRCCGPRILTLGSGPHIPGTRWLPHMSQAVFLLGLIEDICEVWDPPHPLLHRGWSWPNHREIGVAPNNNNSFHSLTNYNLPDPQLNTFTGIVSFSPHNNPGEVGSIIYSISLMRKPGREVKSLA